LDPGNINVWSTSIEGADNKWWGTAPAQFNPANVVSSDDSTAKFTTRFEKGYNPRGDSVESCNCGIEFGDHSSGLLVSKAAFTYGYFEASISGDDNADGLRTSFWLQGAGGEINIVDIFNSDGKTTASNDFHCWGTANDGTDTVSTTNEDDKWVASSMASRITLEGANTYGVLWTTNAITFYVNDNVHRTIAKDVMTCIDAPMHIIMSTETDFTDAADVVAAGNYEFTSNFQNVAFYTISQSNFADCTQASKGGQCRKITGPHGGQNACTWNQKKSRCFNTNDFVDNIASEPVSDSESKPVLASADCTASTKSKCKSTQGPNGGKKACKWKKKKAPGKKCTTNKAFVDNDPIDAQSDSDSASADCTSVSTKGKCRKILGPNGGNDACKWKNRDLVGQKCVDNPKFIDNDVFELSANSKPSPKADCAAAIDWSTCLQTTGPNGGKYACRFNRKNNKCLNDEAFEDNTGRHVRATLEVRGREIEI
jgi:beta-glucanase (GH16 family)